MLTFNFPRAFKLRGIDKPFSFLVSNGFSPNMSTRIVNNRNKEVNIRNLEKLCLLLKCAPNDLFDWVPGKNDIDLEHHPLFTLKRSDKIIQLAQMIHNIPMDKFDDIEIIVRKELEK